MVEYCCDVKKIYTKIRAEVEVVKQNELHTFSVFPKHYWKSPVQYINVFIQYGEVF